MKIRKGFVSNSSSCSFTMKKGEITKLQYAALEDPERFIELVANFAEFAEWEKSSKTAVVYEDFGWTRDVDWWTLVETDTEMRFDTTMDNFDMLAFAEMLAVPVHDVWHS